MGGADGTRCHAGTWWEVAGADGRGTWRQGCRRRLWTLPAALSFYATGLVGAGGGAGGELGAVEFVPDTQSNSVRHRQQFTGRAALGDI